MINLLKSLLVFIGLSVLVLFSIIAFVKCHSKYRSGMPAKSWIIISLCCSVVSICGIVLFSNYLYPFEREIQTTLVAEFEVPKEYELDYPGQKFWHGAYEQYGLYAESFYFDPDNKKSMYGFEWPDMDFDNYCYIITYGQQIESLSYNVWDTIDDPIRTGAKVGHMDLSDEFKSNKVYVYQIPKIRIENDVNDVYRTWE